MTNEEKWSENMSHSGKLEIINSNRELFTDEYFISVYKLIHINYQGLVPVDIKSALRTCFIYATLAAREKAQAEIDKWERMARCPYQHAWYPPMGPTRGYCNKCGWMQSMSEVASGH